MATFAIPAFEGDRVVRPPETATARVPTDQFDRQIDQIVTPQGAGGGGGTADIQFPFQIYAGTAMIDAGTSSIIVRYGTLQDNEPAGVAEPQSLIGDGTNYVFLHLVVDIDGVYSSSELVIDLSPQPADGDYDGYITLGNVEVEDGLIAAINQAATHSLRFAMCGRVVDEGVLVEAGTFEFWGF